MKNDNYMGNIMKNGYFSKSLMKKLDLAGMVYWQHFIIEFQICASP